MTETKQSNEHETTHYSGKLTFFEARAHLSAPPFPAHTVSHRKDNLLMQLESLRGELERLFELNELMALSSSLLGFQPDIIGGTSTMASFVRALTEYCERRGAVEALCDAVAGARPDVNPLLLKCRDAGLTPSQELSSGDVLGSFHLDAEIAEAAQGVCFVAHMGEESYRLKVLHPESLRDARGAHRFLTFNRMLSNVDAPGTPKQILVGREQGKVFIAHRLLVGEPLSEKLAHGGPMPEAEVYETALRLAEYLTALHAAGLCHGNLKLENIIVSSKDANGLELQVQDAGTDLLRSRRSLNGHLPVLLIAAPGTLAPERLLGSSRDTPADVYAVGAILYELVCGRPPFAGDTALELAMRQVDETPKAPLEVATTGWISAPFSDLILRLLNKDPNQRPGDGAALIEELSLLVKDEAQKPPLTPEQFAQTSQALIDTPTSEEAAHAIERAAVGETRTEAYRILVQAGSMLDADENQEVRTSLLLRGARGLRSCRELDDSEAAFELIVQASPDNEAAWHGLDDVRSRQGKHETIVESLLTRLDVSESPSQRAALMARIGDLYAEKLDDAEQAAIAYCQAFCEEPTNASYVRRIEQVAQSDSQIWSEVLSNCGDVSADTDKPEEVRVPLLQQMGKWYTEKQPRPELALPCFQTVLRLSPTHGGAVSGMASVYRSNKMWTELSDLLVRQADVSPTPSDARELRTQAADVFATQLDDTEGARRLYERILTEDPADLNVTRALGKIYEESDEVDRLVPLLERQIAEEQGPSRHAALCRLGQLHRSPVGDLDKSRTYYEAVLAENPAHSEARLGLQETLAVGGQLKELLDSLQTQLEGDPSPRQQVEILAKIAKLQEEEFLQHADAVNALTDVLKLDPVNAGALENLTRLYQTLERWNDLSHVLSRRTAAAEETDLRIALLEQHARILTEHTDKLNEAAECYSQIVSLDPTRTDAHLALSDLHEALGRRDSAIEALAPVAEATSDADAKIRLYLRIAKLHEQGGALEESLLWYRKVIALDATNAQAASRLREEYAQRGDTAGLMDLMRADIANAPTDRAKSMLCMQLAELEMADPTVAASAQQSARQALDWDPTNLQAHSFLADTAYQEERYSDAADHYGVLSERLESLPPGRPGVVVERLVESLQNTGKQPEDGGLKLAEKLLALNPGDPETLLSVAALSFAFGSPERTRQLYEDLLARESVDLNQEQTALANFQLGETLRRLEQWDAALSRLEQAHQYMPNSVLPSQAICRLYKEREDWPALLSAKSELLNHPSVENRGEIMVQMGEIALEHLGDATQAMSHFRAALEELPDDRRVLRRLMQLHSEQEDWGELVEVVEKLASFVDDAQQKAKYLMTAAKVSARHLKERKRAIEFYRQVLALDPYHPKVLSECVVLQIEDGDTEGAEEALQLQLGRAHEAGSQALQLEMLDALFALYHRVPEKLDNAVDVVHQAQRLSPEDPIHEERLGELYQNNAARYADLAIPLNLRILQRKPDNEQAYRRLRQLYTDTRHADPAWCLCQVLDLLHLSEPEESRFFERHRSPQAAPAQASLTPEDWQECLVHPMTDDRLTQIFAVIEPTMVASRSQSFETLGYDPRMAVDLSQHPYPLAQMLFYVASVMGMSAPPTFENHHEPGGLLFLNSHPPSIVMGLSALQQLPPQTAAFIAARQLTHYRPGFHVRHLVSSIPVLKAWLFAALKSCAPNFAISPELEGPVAEARAALDSQLSPASRDRLVELVSELLQSSPSIDLKDWVTGVDLTADRVGLVLANDLKSVTDILKKVDDPTSPPRERRLQELVLFAVSEPFFRVRQKLGLAIESTV